MRARPFTRRIKAERFRVAFLIYIRFSWPASIGIPTDIHAFLCYFQTGDRIIEVDGVDLRNSTHERAVKAIQAAGNPVRLLVQSLVHLVSSSSSSLISLNLPTYLCVYLFLFRLYISSIYNGRENSRGLLGAFFFESRFSRYELWSRLMYVYIVGRYFQLRDTQVYRFRKTVWNKSEHSIDGKIEKIINIIVSFYGRASCAGDCFLKYEMLFIRW